MKKLLNLLKNNLNVCVYGAFLVIELAFFITFVSLDALGNNLSVSTNVKFFSILLCFALSAYQFYRFGNDGSAIFIAFLITAVADTFLLVLESYTLGITTFIFAQLIYFARIYLTIGKKPIISVISRICAVVIAIIILAKYESLTFLTAATSFYFINLLANFVDSFLLIKINRQYAIFTLGLLLFICCDVCVGLMNFEEVLGVEIPHSLFVFADIAAWIFYLPSQVLIVLSARKAVYKTRNGALKDVNDSEGGVYEG
ncbi:MAG: hypothetical protein J6B04_03245 [Clostridia bacterium]|nr:hypothetical protein [Clostridia bacterium]